MNHDTSERDEKRPARRVAVDSRTFVLLAALGLAAIPGAASASTGGTQLFAWANQESSAIGQFYFPNTNYLPAESPSTVGITRLGPGQYEVGFASDPFGPLQAQVVAYGSDNTRCKFFQRPKPVFDFSCVRQMASGPVSPAWCAHVFVLCNNPSGGAVNSKFAISFTGPASNVTPPLQGPAAFFETTGSGTDIARVWTLSNGVPTPSSTRMSFNSAINAPPRITRNFQGNYRVTIPGLGTSNPGLAQITALGAGSTHCLTTLPAQSGSDIIFNVNCWAGTSRTDSDFVVNYDQVVTRQRVDFQGARAFADRSGSSFYTPSKSFNSGSVSFDPGSNTIIRLGTGAYAVDHSKLSAVNSSPWVGPFNNDGSYCKVRSWTPDFGSSSGVTLDVRCFNAQGSPSDTMFFETYQGPPMGPH